MIRDFKNEDLDRIMEIWLAENISAHNFIDPDFFKNNAELVRIVLPSSTIYVQDNNGVQGFIGLMDNYIAGLFVAKDSQARGFGSLLVSKAKQEHNELFVHVYKQNSGALEFYKKQGFEVAGEGFNEETGLPEILLHCKVEHRVKIGKCAL